MQGEAEERRTGVKAEDCTAVHPYRDGTCVVSGEWMGAIEEVEVGTRSVSLHANHLFCS